MASTQSRNPTTCIRCRGADSRHSEYCEVVAFRNGMAAAGLMQLEEGQVAKRYGLSARVVSEAGRIVDALA